VAKLSAVEKAPEKPPESDYPPETSKFMSWTAIHFIRSPTSKMLDVTCFILIGALSICLILSRVFEIDVGVTGSAEITADGGVKEVVSQLDGLVTKVFKKNGDTVKDHELIAILQMDEASPEVIQEMTDTINKLTKRVESEISPVDLKIAPIVIPTSKIYDSILLQALANVEHSFHNFQADRERTLALISRRGKSLNKLAKGSSSEVSFSNQRIEFLTKRLNKMKASPSRQLLASYIDSTEEEIDRLKTQVSSTQTRASTVLDQSFSELLRSLRIAAGALDAYKEHHEIRAPIPGVIGKILDGDHVHVTLNRSIATIIPTNSQFIARIRMKSKDLVRIKKRSDRFLQSPGFSIPALWALYR